MYQSVLLDGIAEHRYQTILAEAAAAELARQAVRAGRADRARSHEYRGQRPGGAAAPMFPSSASPRSAETTS